MSPEEGWGGILIEPGGGEGISCGVVPTGSALEARVDGEVRAAIGYAGIRVSTTGMEDRYLSFDGGSDAGPKILVPDRAVAERMVALGAPRAVADQLRRVSALRARKRAGRWGILVAVGGALAALSVAAWACLGWAVSAAVAGVPVAWETEIGRAAAADVLAEAPVCSDPDLNRAIQEIGRRLAAGMGATPHGWRIRVVDAEEVNAFALPGGYVFINRGLVESAADGQEVAGVLAHEIQHVLRRHGLGNVVRGMGLALILRVAVGDSGAVERFVAANAASLVGMSFSREQEAEADEGGLDLLYRASLDPDGLSRFLGRLAEEEGSLGSVPAILSTHPATEWRIERLAELASSRGRPTVVPLEADWAAVRERCGPVAIADPDAP